MNINFNIYTIVFCCHYFPKCYFLADTTQLVGTLRFVQIAEDMWSQNLADARTKREGINKLNN